VKWVPMQPISRPVPQPDHALELARITGKDAEEIYKMMIDANKKADYFINDLYQVTRTIIDDDLIQLNIRRRDGKPIFRDWRHFQQIKNELIGEEHEAVELYPAESRKVDTSNKYHLWCLRKADARFPFGYNERLLMDETDTKRPGLKQRKA